MHRLCFICNRNYLVTLHNKKDKSTYIKFTNNNINLDEVDNILNDYITFHCEKFNSYLIRCEVVIEFDNNFEENIESEYFYFYNKDINNLKRNLLYGIIPKIYKDRNDCNIKQMILKTINDSGDMTNKYNKNLPMSMVEKRLKITTAKKPSLIKVLDRNKNQPLFRKNSHFI